MAAFGFHSQRRQGTGLGGSGISSTHLLEEKFKQKIAKLDKKMANYSNDFSIKKGGVEL
jgi:hypothetical protein